MFNKRYYRKFITIAFYCKFIELIGVDRREYILKDKVEQERDNYNFIIIDCPPSLSMLTVNAMTTADTVIVPIQCEYYAIEGLIK